MQCLRKCTNAVFKVNDIVLALQFPAVATGVAEMVTGLARVKAHAAHLASADEGQVCKFADEFCVLLESALFSWDDSC